jgi:hypothetical protein
MRINFRQGIVSHQAGGFLSINPSGNVDLLASNRPTTVTIAHKNTNYTWSEDNTISSAWLGPFNALTQYWLYWDFDLLTFQRSFGTTTLEPVAQSVEPGIGDQAIVGVVPGAPGVGRFIVENYFALRVNRRISVYNSTICPSVGVSNNGLYTVQSISFNETTGQTTIYVNQTIRCDNVSGFISTDVDHSGIALRTSGRIWYNTSSNTHYVLQGNVWREVLRVFAAQLVNGNAFISQSINSTTTNYTGTQIGNNSSVRAGRVLFDEASNPIRRDNGTFFTTEDQFFANASRVDAIRLESNVARAQYVETQAIAAYTIVAWIANGQVRTAQYDDIGTTVLGVLTEDLLYKETGSVVIQGVVQNPAWDFTSTPFVNVGDPLWVDNGALVTYDPHVIDSITYPIGQVPVARILDKDSVIFEQGLGGKGDRGPAGSIEDLPYATTTILGGVTLVTPSSSEEKAYVISDTDTRLTNARTPLPHTHAAIDVSVTPTGGITATNAQSALQQLDTNKLSRSGGTMTGFLVLNDDPVADLHAVPKRYIDNSFVKKEGDIMTGYLTLHDDPISPQHAATKRYVDENIAGLIWLDPLDVTDVLGDDILDPTTIDNPELGDGYILPGAATTSSAGGGAGQVGTLIGADFSPFVGCIIEYHGTTPRPGATQIGNTGWYCVYNINQEILTHDVRTGVGHESLVATNPTGSFVNSQGKINVIAKRTTPLVFGMTRALDGITCQCYIPVQGDTYFVHNEKSWHYGDSWSFQGIHNHATYGIDGDNRWLQISALQTLIAGDNVELTGNLINVVNYDDGGTIDAMYWQNLIPNDLDLIYAPIMHSHDYAPSIHSHNGAQITLTEYTSSIPGLGGYTSNNVQFYANEVFDKKASLTPFYSNATLLPNASSYHGMIAVVDNTGRLVYSHNGLWNPVSPETHTHTIPYDMAFFIAGLMQPSTTVGSFAITRNVFIAAGAPGSVVKADVAASVATSLDVLKNGVIIGSIDYSIGSLTGAFTLVSPVNLITGDLLQIKTRTSVDVTLRDLTITIVGCAQTTNCSMA